MVITDVKFSLNAAGRPGLSRDRAGAVQVLSMTDLGATSPLCATSARASRRNPRGWRLSIVATRPTGRARRLALTDRTGRSLIVLIETSDPHDTPLGPLGHLGVACESRAEVDRLCAAAQAEDRLRRGAIDNGPPIGYTAFLADPDGNSLELSYGQEVGLAVARVTAL